MDLPGYFSHVLCLGSGEQARRVAHLLPCNFLDLRWNNAVSSAPKIPISWLTVVRYLTFALVLIPYKAVKEELAESKFTFAALFSNSVFFTLIVSLLSTYVLWIFISLISLDAWHIVTSVRKLYDSISLPF